DHALKSRGGIEEVRRRSTGHPRNFAIQLDFLLDGLPAAYGFEVAAQPQGGFLVKHEKLQSQKGSFLVKAGEVIGGHSNGTTLPPGSTDRLFLVNAAGLPNFRLAYDVLANMRFYNLNPELMKKPQKPDAGELLHRDGGNIASVLARLAKEKPA